MTWPTPALITLGVLLLLGLLGWWLATSRGSRLAAAEDRARGLDTQVAQVNSMLTQERQAAGDLNTFLQIVGPLRTKEKQMARERIAIKHLRHTGRQAVKPRLPTDNRRTKRRISNGWIQIDPAKLDSYKAALLVCHVEKEQSRSHHYPRGVCRRSGSGGRRSSVPAIPSAQGCYRRQAAPRCPACCA